MFGPGFVSFLVVILLLNHCFMYLTLFLRGSVFVFVLLCVTLFPFWFCNQLDKEGRAACFALIFFLMSCDSSSLQCSRLVCSV